MKGIGALALAIPAGAFAQGGCTRNRDCRTARPHALGEIVRFDVEARVDYRYTGVDGHTDKKHSGFGREGTCRCVWTVRSSRDLPILGSALQQAAGFLRSHGMDVSQL